MRQPVLPLLPAEARPVGASAGLMEGPDGGVVFVFGLATFAYAAGDEIGRRLAAVQLMLAKLATVGEVAAAFGVSDVTVWRWGQAFARGGVGGLGRDRTGPKGPVKLTAELAARIVALDGQGRSLRAIAAATGVSTATVRVALGRVARRGATAGPGGPGPSAGCDTVEDDTAETDTAETDTAETDVVATDTVETDTVETDTVEKDVAADVVAADTRDGGCAGLVVLAPPVPRTAERAAARAGELVEAPVVLTEGAQLPLAGLLLALPALAATGRACQVFRVSDVRVLVDVAG